MLTYHNIQRHDDKPFEEYLKLPGYSHSWLKHQKNGIVSPINVTENMKVGSMVDHILTEPGKVNMADPIYPACKSIAYEIRKNFAPLIQYFEKQVSFTAEIQYLDFYMPTTGRLDFGLPKHAVIDLKITMSKDMVTLINFMGYFNQIWHYCKMYGVDKAYLMVYSVPLKKTFVYFYDCSSNLNQFWSRNIIDFGTVKNKVLPF